MPTPLIAETKLALRERLASWRGAGNTLALVPTMGALHAGHLALVAHARREAAHVVVSIFVNPTQFAPNEDFATYPRTFDEDCKALAEAGADLVYAPTAQDMYPPDFATRITLSGPAEAGLEDRFRPTHFAGVATVVAKLFMRVIPDIAIFGQKDYQQLQVITRMAADLDLNVRVLGAETLREADGLAMSSRNRYLTPEQRAIAPTLHAALQACAADLRKGRDVDASILAASRTIADHGFVTDYLEARNAHTLAPIAHHQPAQTRLLVAARLGTTRLIDNIAV